MQQNLVKVWDWPLRLFHWGLLVCVLGCITTIKAGGDWMDWHVRFGYGAAGLIVFRLVWGVVGTRYSRFSSFSFTPRETWRYARGRSHTYYRGHNPLGALSVFAMLTVLGFQAFGGLFTSDDIAFEGPLAHLLPSAWVAGITGLHKANQWLIYGLIGLHVAAISFYTLVKREKLIAAMVHGKKPRFAPPASAPQPAWRPGAQPGAAPEASSMLSSML